MSKYLMVPIRLDALYVHDEELAVVEQNANFSILPFFEKTLKEEINCETANISESIVSQAFQNENLRLGHGIHLHWAMPDALTHGDSGMSFPELPNRWLITRRKKNGEKWELHKQWVVESDYLFPPGVNKRGVSVNIPFHSARWIWSDELQKYEYKPEDKSTNAKRASQPFRFMGRKMNVSAWRKCFPKEEYNPSLTALGYGDPTFAAFYPNCFSVFGIHDNLADIGDFALSDLRYELVGWYNDDSYKKDPAQIKDPLTKFIKQNTGASIKDIKEKFDWEIAEKKSGMPGRLLCYAGLTFEIDQFVPNSNKDAKVSITVANTSTEALSACLAEKLAKTNDPDREKRLKLIEDQLEALQLAFQLDPNKLDTVTKFREFRHKNGFMAVDSGQIWVLRKDMNSKDSVDNLSGKQKSLEELPDNIAYGLHQVNQLQKEYDQAQQEISSLRKQLFADWYKYMICVYPPDITIHDYPDPDLVKYFIQKKVIRPLEEKIQAAGNIEEVTKDKNNNISGVKAGSDSHKSSIAVRLADKANSLIRAVEDAEAEINKKNKTSINYYLEQISSPRFCSDSERKNIMLKNK